MAFLSHDEIQSIGFKSVGDNVQISHCASFYGADRIKIGSNVRIDDFCVLSAGEGGIEIGRHVHIAVGSTLIGKGLITLSDFTNLSSRVSIYSSNDDYSGASLTNPTIPNYYKKVVHAPVTLGRHAIVGSGSVILPGIKIGEGVAIGALSLVSKDCEEFGIYAGNPVKKLRERKRDLLKVERRFLMELRQKDK